MEIERSKSVVEFPKLNLPIILWVTGSVFLIKKLDDPWILSKIDVRNWNKHCRTMKILDSSGRSFNIERWEEVPERGAIGAFFRRWSWNARVVPVIKGEKQLTLEEFKIQVKRAVSSRQGHDQDSSILAKTMKKLPQATTYREAIESLPKLI